MLVAVVVTAPVAHAWTPLRDARGEALSWPDTAWPLALADGSAAWAQAAAGWTAAAEVGFRPVPAAPLAPDGVVALATVTDAADWRALVGDDALVAFTLVTSEGPTLIDADVVLNAARFTFAEPPAPRVFALRTVLVHELGHVLGLGHSCSEAGAPACGSDEAADAAAMFPQVPPGEVRGPAADDRAGLAARVRYPLTVRRPRIEAVESSDGGWRVELGGSLAEDVVRVWADSPVPARIVRAPSHVEIRTDAPPPLGLEVWTSAGQGAFAAGILADADTDTDAAVGDAGGGRPARGGAGGCGVVGGRFSWPVPVEMFFWVAAVAATRRTRRRG